VRALSASRGRTTEIINQQITRIAFVVQRALQYSLAFRVVGAKDAIDSNYVCQQVGNVSIYQNCYFPCPAIFGNISDLTGCPE
jgi:hypothetical protein